MTTIIALQVCGLNILCMTVIGFYAFMCVDRIRIKLLFNLFYLKHIQRIDIIILFDLRVFVGMHMHCGTKEVDSMPISLMLVNWKGLKGWSKLWLRVKI